MTTTRLAIDIETAPALDKLDQLPEPEVALGNLVDPTKIAAKKAAARQEQVGRMALDPHFGRIISIAVARRTADRDVPQSVVFQKAEDHDQYDGERAVLLAAWTMISEHTGGYATFNGAAFDLPYMVRRSILLGVPVYKMPTGKYQTCDSKSEHLDVYNVLANSSSNPLRLPQTLAYYAKALLGRVCPHDVDHATLGDLFASGEDGRRIVAEVNEWDAESTLLLAELCERYYP